jgi:hypothetical protein
MRMAKFGATAVAIKAASNGNESPFTFSSGGMIGPALRAKRPRPTGAAGGAAAPPAEICSAPARSSDERRWSLIFWISSRVGFERKLSRQNALAAWARSRERERSQQGPQQREAWKRTL